MNTSIYQNIATRTAGDIYIGVVGPVRTGKSTFIKRFMETQIIPNIENVYRKERARDELPQSGSGRTIMTAEPKFVPEEAAQIQLEGGAAFSVRLIDCVGYMVRGRTGADGGRSAPDGHYPMVRPSHSYDGGGGDRHAKSHHGTFHHRDCHHDGRQHLRDPAGGLSGAGGTGHPGIAGDREALHRPAELSGSKVGPGHRHCGGYCQAGTG